MVHAVNKPLSKMHQRVNSKVEERTALGSEGSVRVNTFWSDASELYFKSMDAIEVTHGQLAQLLKYTLSDPACAKRIKDPQTLTQNVELLTRDIVEHKARLDAIYAEHSEKSGSTVDPDDTMAVIVINGKYADAMEVYQTVVMPTVTHIFEQIGAIEELIEAERQAKADEAQRQLADVAVISDVVDKNEVVSNA